MVATLRMTCGGGDCGVGSGCLWGAGLSWRGLSWNGRVGLLWGGDWLSCWLRRMRGGLGVRCAWLDM